MMVVYPYQIGGFSYGLFMAAAGCLIFFWAVCVWLRESAHIAGSFGVLMGMIMAGSGTLMMVASVYGQTTTEWVIPLPVVMLVVVLTAFGAGVLCKPICSLIKRHFYPEVKLCLCELWSELLDLPSRLRDLAEELRETSCTCSCRSND